MNEELAPNQTVEPGEIAAIRSLEDFDLVMLISEIHDHGWPTAKKLLLTMLEAQSFGSR